MPASASARSITTATPWRSMSFIVKTCTFASRMRCFSCSSRLRTPMSTVRSALDLRRAAADRRQLRRLRAEERRERHPVHVAARRRRRRVHVAVRVDPEQADVAAVAPRQSPPTRPPIRPRASGRRRARSAARPPGATARRADTAADTRARSRGCTSFSDRARRAFRESACRDRPCRRPRSRCAASRSPSPAIRTADGPMSTPRRPPPRSSGTPRMWTVRCMRCQAGHGTEGRQPSPQR